MIAPGIRSPGRAACGDDASVGGRCGFNQRAPGRARESSWRSPTERDPAAPPRAARSSRSCTRRSTVLALRPGRLLRRRRRPAPPACARPATSRRHDRTAAGGPGRGLIGVRGQELAAQPPEGASRSSTVRSASRCADYGILVVPTEAEVPRADGRVARVQRRQADRGARHRRLAASRSRCRSPTRSPRARVLMARGAGAGEQVDCCRDSRDLRAGGRGDGRPSAGSSSS